MEEEEKESPESLRNIPRKEVIDLSEVNMINGHEVQHVMTLEFIQRGYHAFCNFPDRIRKMLKEKIAADLDINYYIGIIECSRMTFEYLAPTVNPNLYLKEMGQINCRVFFIIRQRSLEEQWQFINFINREKK